MTAETPVDLHPDLTTERLSALARFIADVRISTLQDHHPDQGEGAWSLGCRVYERTVNQLQYAIMDGTFPWLAIVSRRNLEFCFSVGMVPVRFFHDTSGCKRHSVRITLPELQAWQEAFEFSPAPELDSVLRIGYETDELGCPSRFYLIQLEKTSQKPHQWWEIEFEWTALPADVIDFATHQLDEPVDLPPVSVSAVSQEVEDDADDALGSA